MFIIELASGFLYKTAKDSFSEWAKKEGVSLIDHFVKEGIHTEGFSLLGKSHVVKDNLWKSVSSQIEQPALVAAINLEVAAYSNLPGLLCLNSDNLPDQACPGVLRGITALPRRAVNEAAMKRLTKAIGNSQLLRESQAGSELLVSYFLRDVVREMDEQYSKAYLGRSPMEIHEPRETAGNWTVIGLDAKYPWPTSESPGHYLLYHDEFANFQNLKRKDKDTLETQLTKLEGKLGSFKPEEKNSLVDSIIFRLDSKFSSYSDPKERWKMVTATATDP